MGPNLNVVGQYGASEPRGSIVLARETCGSTMFGQVAMWQHSIWPERHVVTQYGTKAAYGSIVSSQS